MQDPDIPPQEEGNIDGAADGVRRDELLVARWAAIVRSIRESSRLPWITATVPTWATTTAMAAVEGRAGLASLRRIQ